MGLKFIALSLLAAIMVVAMSFTTLPAGETCAVAAQDCAQSECADKAAACDSKKDCDKAEKSDSKKDCDKAEKTDDEAAAACAACTAG